MILVQWIRFALSALLMFAGLATLLATTLGLFRFHYILNRIHVAAKCDTFGVLLTFSSLILMTGWQAASLKILLIMVFLWIANHVSSHLVAHMEVVTNPHLEDDCEVIPYQPD